MRRDYFTLDARNVDWVEEEAEARKPTVHINFEGPASTLRERLTGTDDQLLDAEQTDVAFRLQGPVDDADTSGVVSVTNRITGDFVLELNQDAEDVLKFITAAREYGKETGDMDGRYHVEITLDGEDLVEYDKSTFLVYNDDGNLLRKHSLIPSGVEL